jgi:chromate transporter
VHDRSRIAAPGSFLEIFLAFLRLGLISFGGPVAHIGYFRAEFVDRRCWLDDARYADLVSLCQFLPGPASSQVGFSLGVLRGNGLSGGLAAWLGFTLPSAALMLAFGLGASIVTGPGADTVLHGLKLVAVAVVAQALLGMGRTLTPDVPRIAIALAALAFALGIGGTFGQILPLAAGALAGLLLGGLGASIVSAANIPVSTRGGLLALALAALLFVLLPLAGNVLDLPQIQLLSAFYRSGALVFGGGHVVLPLLKTSIVDIGWVSQETFLSGYGLAQAMPGPLFTFAAYLGAAAHAPAGGIAGGLTALVMIFLPGLLLVYGILPFSAWLRGSTTAGAGMRGANAAVVGILAAAFIDPVIRSSILGPTDAALAAVGFILLVALRMPSWAVVLLLPMASAVLTLI